MAPSPRTLAVSALLLAGTALAACVPPPGGGTGTTTTTTTTSTVPAGPGQPVVSFATVGPVGPAPALAALAWTVSDPDGDTLTCRLDADGDGGFETVLTPCPAEASRTVALDAPGTTTARLRVEDGSTAPVDATAAVTVDGAVTEQLDLELRGLDGLDPAVAAAFTDAATRWEELIVRGLSDIVTGPRPGCLPATSPDLPGTVDDLVVDVRVEPIDGVGGVLGSAGPTCIRTSSELPVHGVMTFDDADVAQLVADGSFGAVVRHELAHVLGFGTVWDLPSQGAGTRVVITGAGTTDPRFTGPLGVAEWSTLGRTGTVPVEATGGPGTADSHWRETTFDTELMTGWIDPGVTPLSRISVASLADLGYRVDLDAADPYALPGFQSLLRLSEPQVELEMTRPPVAPL